MSRTYTIALGSLLMLLAACGAQKTAEFSLNIKNADEAKTMMLIQASEQVMQRRLAAAGVSDAVVTAIPDGENVGKLTVQSKDDKGIKEALLIAKEPFTFELRIEKQPGTTPSAPDINWNPTAVNNDAVVWLRPVGNKDTGSIGVELELSEQGRKDLADVFRKNKGKNLGIFVRGLLVSTMKIQSETLEERVVIDGVPSQRIAEVFSDDVNVGLHVTMTPR